MDDLDEFLARLRAERRERAEERLRLRQVRLQARATRMRLCAERAAILAEIVAKRPTLRWHLAHHGHPRFVGALDRSSSAPAATATDQTIFDDTVVPLRRRGS